YEVARVKVEANKCDRCERVWLAPASTLRCPSCKSPYWNRGPARQPRASAHTENQPQIDIVSIIGPEKSTKSVDTKREHATCSQRPARVFQPILKPGDSKRR